MTFPGILTAALAAVGLVLLCGIVATALHDLWRSTRTEGVARPFRLALIAIAFVFLAALLGAGLVTILSTVLL